MPRQPPPLWRQEARQVPEPAARGPLPGRAGGELGRLLQKAPIIRLGQQDRLLILSDLHVGDGGSTDDFLPNSELVLSALGQHYLKRGFKLLLNGDIEELHRFPLHRILRRWTGLYNLLGQFAVRNALFRILGNHDYGLRGSRLCRPRTPLHDALRFDFRGQTIFVLHGCRALSWHRQHMWLGRLLLRYVANPLGIRNHSVRYDSRRRFRLERKLYQFARDQQMVTIIGHTHRPLFESLSKVDSLKFQIEAMCRQYPLADAAEKEALQLRIQACRAEFQHTLAKDRKGGVRNSLYDVEPVVPCLFNSGCAVGKRGITAIEVADGNIALVHWFDAKRSSKYLGVNGIAPQRLAATDYFRTVLKEDSLGYVFARIKLLG